MRLRRTVILVAISPALLLLQLDLSGCLNPGSGGSGGTGGPSFNLPPVAIAEADITRGIAPLTVRFSSSASTDDGVIVTRIWDFGDGQTSRDISPTHTYQSTGEYRVTLTLTDNNGAVGRRTLTIFVTERPVAIIRVDRTASETAPAIFRFDGSDSFDPDFVSTGAGDRCNPAGICEYRWDFGDGSRELLPALTHTFALPGTYRVRLTVTDNLGITGVAEQVIEVGIPRPTISFRSPPPTLQNLVVSNTSPLWVYGVFTVDPSVARTIRVGLDGDNDLCESQAVAYGAANGALLARLTGHGDPVRTAVFTPDGRYILTGSDDRTVRMYLGASPFSEVLLHNGVMTEVRSIAVAPDSQRFAVGTATNQVVTRQVEVNSALRELLGHTRSVNAVAYAPDQSLLASGDAGGSVILWDPDSGVLLRQINAHGGGVNGVAFSPVNPSLLATAGDDLLIKLWDTASGTLLREFSGHTNGVTAVVFSPDGARLASASADSSVRLWDVASGALQRTLTGHSDRTLAVAFSPDGTRLASGSADASARLWSVADGAALTALRPCQTPISAVAYSPDGQTLLTGVAASNDIQLDTVPSSGNDLNFSIPQALSLAGVPFATPKRTYFLWAEIDTDQTSPVRSYSPTQIHVVPPFTAGVDAFTPSIPLAALNDRAAVVVAPTSQRQIFDIGSLNRGDRLFLSLLTTPGYADVYTAPRFSVMLLDASLSLFAWFQDGRTFWTPTSKLVVGHNSNKYYVVIDGFGAGPAGTEVFGPSVNLRVQRGAEPCLRKPLQRIFLNFAGGERVGVGAALPRDIPPFAGSVLNPGWGAGETATIKTRIQQTIESYFEPYQVVVTSSDSSPRPAGPHIIIYFGDEAPFEAQAAGAPFDELGTADFIDPRNDLLGGAVLIYAAEFAEEFPGLIADSAGPTLIGDAMGRTAVHHIGELFGLRHTSAVGDIMRNESSATDPTLIFTVGGPSLAEVYNDAIGTQDAPTILRELLGRTGACCLPGGVCQNEFTESECAAQGGVFRGVNSCCQQLLTPCP